MKTNDMREAVRERKRERRTHEQSSHQIISDEVKAIMKLVSNEKSTQILRDAVEEHLVQENKAAQRLVEIEELSRYAHENRTHRID